MGFKAERKCMSKSKEIKIGDSVNVIPSKMRALPIKARVAGSGGGSISPTVTVQFEDPPTWYQTLERMRGVLMHPSLTRVLRLFQDHTGTWTALEDGKQYTIQKL